MDYGRGMMPRWFQPKCLWISEMSIGPIGNIVDTDRYKDGRTFSAKSITSKEDSWSIIQRHPAST
jgi:hypothetical protein